MGVGVGVHVESTTVRRKKDVRMRMIERQGRSRTMRWDGMVHTKRELAFHSHGK